MTANVDCSSIEHSTSPSYIRHISAPLSREIAHFENHYFNISIYINIRSVYNLNITS